MTVKIDTDTAQVATYFTGLQDASIEGREGKEEEEEDQLFSLDTSDEMNPSGTTQNNYSSARSSSDAAEVRLDIRKFSQLLHSQQPHAEKMIFSEFCPQ